jgi:hypothetical protein
MELSYGLAGEIGSGTPLAKTSDQYSMDLPGCSFLDLQLVSSFNKEPRKNQLQTGFLMMDKMMNLSQDQQLEVLIPALTWFKVLDLTEKGFTYILEHDKLSTARNKIPIIPYTGKVFSLSPLGMLVYSMYRREKIVTPFNSDVTQLWMMELIDPFLKTDNSDVKDIGFYDVTKIIKLTLGFIKPELRRKLENRILELGLDSVKIEEWGKDFKVLMPKSPPIYQMRMSLSSAKEDTRFDILSNTIAKGWNKYLFNSLQQEKELVQKAGSVVAGMDADPGLRLNHLSSFLALPEDCISVESRRLAVLIMWNMMLTRDFLMGKGFLMLTHSLMIKIQKQDPEKELIQLEKVKRFYNNSKKVKTMDDFEGDRKTMTEAIDKIIQRRVKRIESTLDKVGKFNLWVEKTGPWEFTKETKTQVLKEVKGVILENLNRGRAARLLLDVKSP